MPLAKFDRSPPPFFRQGPSALTKLMVCAAAAVFLMVADARLQVATALRSGVAAALHPVQKALYLPVKGLSNAGDYGQGLARAVAGEDAAKRALAQARLEAAQLPPQIEENVRLRELLALRPALGVLSVAAEVLYEAPDPFSRKIVLDRGGRDGLQLGSPVLSEQGLVGQISRVHPTSAEVTLTGDRQFLIPLVNERTGQRALAQGHAPGALKGNDLPLPSQTQGWMELRFVAGNADIQIGDIWLSSGIDGVYPAGLKVAQVHAIDRQAGGKGFAQVLLEPLASADGLRQVLVLEPLSAQKPELATAKAEQVEAERLMEQARRASKTKRKGHAASAASDTGGAQP